MVHLFLAVLVQVQDILLVVLVVHRFTLKVMLAEPQLVEMVMLVLGAVALAQSAQLWLVAAIPLEEMAVQGFLIPLLVRLFFTLVVVGEVLVQRRLVALVVLVVVEQEEVLQQPQAHLQMEGMELPILVVEVALEALLEHRVGLGLVLAVLAVQAMS